MAKLTPKERILQERGLLVTKPVTKKHRVIRPNIKPTFDGKPKTTLMRYIELRYGKPIEEILLLGSLSTIAKFLNNEVDTTTLSKWIKRFKLRYNADNLPTCDGCTHQGTACEGGICYVLLNLGLYDLVEVKKKEVLSG